MPPSELAKRLKNLQIKSTELQISLVALNRDSSILTSRLEAFDVLDFSEHDWEYLQEATRTYADTLDAVRKYLEVFCDTAGHVFDGGISL